MGDGGTLVHADGVQTQTSMKGAASGVDIRGQRVLAAPLWLHRASVPLVSCLCVMVDVSM
jgi:hypothetical protein